MSRMILGISYFILAFSDIVTPLTFDERHSLFQYKVANFNSRHHTSKYRNPHTTNSDPGYQDKLNQLNPLISKYEDRVRYILNNNYPFRYKISEIKQENEQISHSSISNVNDQNDVSLSPVPLNSINKNTPINDYSTLHETSSSVSTDIQKRDPAKNETIPLSDPLSSKEIHVPNPQNITRLADASYEASNATITEDGSQTAKDQSTPFVDTESNPDEERRQSESIPTNSDSDETHAPISSATELNTPTIKSTLNESVDESSRDLRLTTSSAPNGGKEDTKITDLETASQRTSAFPKENSTFSTMDEEKEVAGINPENNDTQSTATPVIPTSETKANSDDGKIISTDFDSSVPPTVSYADQSETSEFKSTEAQKAKLTDDIYISTDLDTAISNTASNSIWDQTKQSENDRSGDKDTQSKQDLKSTFIDTKSRQDSTSSITNAEMNSVKDQTKEPRYFTLDNVVVDPLVKDLRDSDEPQHVVQISSIRTVKTVVVVVFLVVALVATTVLTIYMIKVKRREVQYDQLTLLP